MPKFVICERSAKVSELFALTQMREFIHNSWFIRSDARDAFDVASSSLEHVHCIRVPSYILSCVAYGSYRVTVELSGDVVSVDKSDDKEKLSVSSRSSSSKKQSSTAKIRTTKQGEFGPLYFIIRKISGRHVSFAIDSGLHSLLSLTEINSCEYADPLRWAQSHGFGFHRSDDNCVHESSGSDLATLSSSGLEARYGDEFMIQDLTDSIHESCQSVLRHHLSDAVRKQVQSDILSSLGDSSNPRVCDITLLNVNVKEANAFNSISSSSSPYVVTENPVYCLFPIVDGISSPVLFDPITGRCYSDLPRSWWRILGVVGGIGAGAYALYRWLWNDDRGKPTESNEALSISGSSSLVPSDSENFSSLSSSSSSDFPTTESRALPKSS